jgi:hypothetical protein
MAAYREAILMGGTEQALPRDYADDYIQNVTLNIRHFPQDQSRVLHVALETVEQDFPAFWKRIGAQGNLDAAMAEWRQRSNTGESYVATWQASAPSRLLRKIRQAFGGRRPALARSPRTTGLVGRQTRPAGSQVDSL